jgi:hypothetical protein
VFQTIGALSAADSLTLFGRGSDVVVIVTLTLYLPVLHILIYQ